MKTYVYQRIYTSTKTTTQRRCASRHVEMFETFGHPACVLLEGEAEDADLLVRHRVEQRLHDASREPLHHMIFNFLQ